MKIDENDEWLLTTIKKLLTNKTNKAIQIELIGERLKINTIKYGKRTNNRRNN